MIGSREFQISFTSFRRERPSAARIHRPETPHPSHPPIGNRVDMRRDQENQSGEVNSVPRLINIDRLATPIESQVANKSESSDISANSSAEHRRHFRSFPWLIFEANVEATQGRKALESAVMLCRRGGAAIYYRTNIVVECFLLRLQEKRVTAPLGLIRSQGEWILFTAADDDQSSIGWASGRGKT